MLPAIAEISPGAGKRKMLAFQRLRPRLDLSLLGAAGALAILIAALFASIVAPAGPLLVWNLSPSSPEGLYAVDPAQGLHKGEFVIARPPPAARRLAADRHYLPANVPLVKMVAATAGARVCASGLWILIDGRRAAKRMRHDPAGRPLPWWTGCRALKSGEAFLLSRHAPLAFDGRYFGVTQPSEIIGKATLLWPR